MNFKANSKSLIRFLTTQEFIEQFIFFIYDALRCSSTQSSKQQLFTSVKVSTMLEEREGCCLLRRTTEINKCSNSEGRATRTQLLSLTVSPLLSHVQSPTHASLHATLSWAWSRQVILESEQYLCSRYLILILQYFLYFMYFQTTLSPYCCNDVQTP